MPGTNYYCAGQSCRRTTRHLYVRLENQGYLYCVDCGRRLEVREDARHTNPNRKVG